VCFGRFLVTHSFFRTPRIILLDFCLPSTYPLRIHPPVLSYSSHSAFVQILRPYLHRRTCLCFRLLSISHPLTPPLHFVTRLFMSSNFPFTSVDVLHASIHVPIMKMFMYHTQVARLRRISRGMFHAHTGPR